MTLCQDHDSLVPGCRDPRGRGGALHRPGRAAGPDLCAAAAGVATRSPGERGKRCGEKWGSSRGLMELDARSSTKPSSGPGSRQTS